jgi:hypothetical protein
MAVPYAGATSGNKARDEITRLLKRFGCESVGFMDNFEDHELILAFKHRGRAIRLKASAQGWAALYLKEHPYSSYRSKKTRAEYEQAALHQGDVAVNSILRDWLKGSLCAAETGIFSFEHVFLAHMLTKSGVPLIECIQNQPDLLNAPETV